LENDLNFLAWRRDKPVITIRFSPILSQIYKKVERLDPIHTGHRQIEAAYTGDYGSGDIIKMIQFIRFYWLLRQMTLYSGSRRGEIKTAQTMRRLGWLSFRLLWIPFITLFIGMIGMPEGSYSWVELPSLTRISIVGMAIFAVLAMILLVGAYFVASLEDRSIQKQGIAAPAKILKLWDTGTTINQNPVVRLLLEVQPRGEAAFEAETEQLISRLSMPQIQPGMTVMVKYDPHDHDVVLLPGGDDENQPQFQSQGTTHFK
jgi:hypothetical protein